MRSILAPNPSPMTLDGTRTYLVGRQRPVVIDPGPSDVEHLRRVVDELGGSSPLAILLTHSHPDHSEGALELGALTDAPVLAGEGATWSVAISDRTLSAGERFETDAGTVTAMNSPGHSPDHFAFLWEPSDSQSRRAAFVGDLLLGTGDTALVAWPEGDVALYLDSLDRLLEWGADVLHPAHGPSIAEPARAIRAFREHRLARAADALEALERLGESASDRLVDAVYGDRLDPRLRWAAEASIRATLEYLANRGSVVKSGDRFVTVSRQPPPHP